MLLGLDGDDDADAALFAFEEAALRHARLGILHARTYRHAPAEFPDPYPTMPARETIPHHTPATAAPQGEIVGPRRLTHPSREVGPKSVRSTPWRALIAATAEAELV
ncbi:universal stress protein, partial [Streptomyces daliensis]|nr:universal stress protein [Streptomyces daliensis]